MVRERRYYVYIMASKSRVIYVGMAGFLMARVLRHRAGKAASLPGGIACIGWFMWRRLEMSKMRLPGRRRSRSGGVKRR